MGSLLSQQRSIWKDSDHTFELSMLDNEETEKRKSTMTQILTKDLPLDDTSLKTHQKIMTGVRTIERSQYVGIEYISKPHRFVEANCFKRMVSKKKIRYQDAYFDLDLVYVTKRIIAMGFPSTGCEALYRNSASDIVAFLETYHKHQSKIYNLCLEENRNYNPGIFQSRGIDVAYFPFKDHNPCKVKMIYEFCFDVYLYMLKNPKNVVAIHCKAGKGRTGLMICSYLLFTKMCKDLPEALHLYGSRRTKNAKGLTIASQIRYIQYFQRSLDENCRDGKYTTLVREYMDEPTETLKKIVPSCKRHVKVFNVGPFQKSNNFGFYLEDFEGRKRAVYNLPKLAKKLDKSTILLDNKLEIEKIEEKGEIIYELVLKDFNLILEDDLKIVLYVNSVVLTCWFNIGFLRTFERLKDLNLGYYKGLMFDPKGRIISKKMRHFKFAENNTEPEFYFDEFQSYDFDKWHKKSLEGKLPDNFSFFIGCFNKVSRDSIVAIN